MNAAFMMLLVIVGAIIFLLLLPVIVELVGMLLWVAFMLLAGVFNLIFGIIGGVLLAVAWVFGGLFGGFFAVLAEIAECVVSVGGDLYRRLPPPRIWGPPCLGLGVLLLIALLAFLFH